MLLRAFYEPYHIIKQFWLTYFKSLFKCHRFTNLFYPWFLVRGGSYSKGCSPPKHTQNQFSGWKCTNCSISADVKLQRSLSSSKARRKYQCLGSLNPWYLFWAGLLPLSHWKLFENTGNIRVWGADLMERSWTIMEGIPERQIIYTDLNSIMFTLVTKLVSEGAVMGMQGQKHSKHAVFMLVQGLGFSSVTLRICVCCFTLWTYANGLISRCIVRREKKGRPATHGVRDSEREGEGGKTGGRNVDRMGRVKFTFIFGSNTYAPS